MIPRPDLGLRLDAGKDLLDLLLNRHSPIANPKSKVTNPKRRISNT